MYEVTITNVTRGSFFTPILVASHRPGVNLFTLATSQPGVGDFAEGGDIAPLEQILLVDSNVAAWAIPMACWDPVSRSRFKFPSKMQTRSVCGDDPADQ